jgi:outer membrane protein insertion porin family
MPVEVVGAKEFNHSKIVSLSKLVDGQLYSEGEFAEAALKVKKEYVSKYFSNAKVTAIPKMDASGDSCTVKFLIDEGKRMKVVGCVFAGISEEDSEALSSKLGMFPWWNPVGWFVSALVTDEDLNSSVAIITEYFRELGYLDVKVGFPKRVAREGDDGEADIHYDIILGAKYKIGKTSIRGLKIFSEDGIRSKCKLPGKDEIAGSKKIADAAKRIEVAVGSGGACLYGTVVDVKFIPSAVQNVVDVVYDVKEGERVKITSVKIQGNDYTKDKVVRREIGIAPGDVMDVDKAEQSKRKLENLNYFSRVSYQVKKNDYANGVNGEKTAELVYEVSERNTGNFMFGVGASSIDSVFLTAEVSQSNFDLFAPSKMFRGGGQKGRLHAQVGPRIQTYEASVTEPYLFDRYLEFTVDAYRRLRWYDEYDVVKNGASAALSYPVKFWPTLPPFGELGFKFSAEFIDFDDVDNGVWEYKGKEVSLKEEDRLYGGAFEPVARIFWARDTRDTYRFPTKGSMSNVFFDLAAFGDNKYWRAGVRHRNYFRIWEKYRHVLMAAFRAEVIDGISDEVPIYNRLFLGGPRSIRGIEYRNVSPMAKKGDNEWTPWGGQTLVCANFEYTIPVVSIFRIALFSDIGSVGADDFDFSSDFAWTAGVGIRLDIPQFPVRLDFAAPIKKPDEAEEEVFSFTVGYDF